MPLLTWSEVEVSGAALRSGMVSLLRRDTAWNGTAFSVEVDISTPETANIYLYEWRTAGDEKDPNLGQWCFRGPHMYISTSAEPTLTDAEWITILESMENRILTPSEELLASCGNFLK